MRRFNRANKKKSYVHFKLCIVTKGWSLYWFHFSCDVILRSVMMAYCWWSQLGLIMCGRMEFERNTSGFVDMVYPSVVITGSVAILLGYRFSPNQFAPMNPMNSSWTFCFEFADHLQWIKEREVNMFCEVFFHHAHNLFFLGKRKINFKRLIACWVDVGANSVWANSPWGETGRYR